MTDEELIGYLFDLLDPAERAAVESFVAAHPEAAARLDQFRVGLAPLETDREQDAVPAGLAVRTLVRMAEYLVEHEPRTSAARSSNFDVLKVFTSQPRVGTLDSPNTSLPEPSRNGSLHDDGLSTLKPAPPERPDWRVIGGRFRADLVVAAGIGLIAVGLVFSGISRARHERDVMACQNNLRALHTGLSGYADNHEGRFPQIGTDPYPTAGTFVRALSDAGQFPTGFTPICPAAAESDRADGQQVRYTYTLGHTAPGGGVVGLWRSSNPADQNDLLPIAADCPAAGLAPGAGPLCPHRSMNVLFVGGNVRATTTPKVGPYEDDIYRNWRGKVEAGRDRADVVLGRAPDRP